MMDLLDGRSNGIVIYRFWICSVGASPRDPVKSNNKTFAIIWILNLEFLHDFTCAKRSRERRPSTLSHPRQPSSSPSLYPTKKHQQSASHRFSPFHSFNENKTHHPQDSRSTCPPCCSHTSRSSSPFGPRESWSSNGRGARCRRLCCRLWGREGCMCRCKKGGRGLDIMGGERKKGEGRGRKYQFQTQPGCDCYR